MRLEILHRPASGGAGRPRAPVLFVHGAYCAAWVWAQHMMDYFAASGFACHAVSLRGHGGSAGSCDWASLADYVDDLAEAARGMPEPAVLVGHSMGGLVAQHYASRGDAVARAVVMMASVPPSGLAASAMHMSVFAPDVLWNLGLLQSLGPDAVNLAAVHRALLSPATPVAEMAALLPRLQRESQRISIEMMAPPLPLPLRGRFPAFVVGGDRDVFLPMVSLHECALYHGADLDLLKGAPHGLMLDRGWWQPAADSIIAWLDQRAL